MTTFYFTFFCRFLSHLFSCLALCHHYHYYYPADHPSDYNLLLKRKVSPVVHFFFVSIKYCEADLSLSFCSSPSGQSVPLVILPHKNSRLLLVLVSTHTHTPSSIILSLFLSKKCLWIFSFNDKFVKWTGKNNPIFLTVMLRLQLDLIRSSCRTKTYNIIVTLN